MRISEKRINNKILVIGLGKSGYAVAKLLLQRGYKVWVYTDFIALNEKEKFLSLVHEGVKFFKQNQNLQQFNFVVKNPGIKYNHHLIKIIINYKIPIYTEPYIAYKFFVGKIIAVTGTNGKSTTSTLIYEFLKRKYNNVYLVGNIGTPFSDIVNNSSKKTICVLELSSFQILGMPKFKPYISIILNIAPDHLDFHEDYSEYKHTKLKIIHEIKNKVHHYIILNFDDLLLNKISVSNVLFFSTKKNSNDKIYSYVKDGSLCLKDKLKFPKSLLSSSVRKNIDNCLAALCVAGIMNINVGDIKNVLRTFSSIEHRLENAGMIKGRKIINDSKCTNMFSLEYALNSINVPVVLMMGGRDRNDNFYLLVKHKKKIKIVISFGECNLKIKNFCMENGILCYNYENLRKAIDKVFVKSNRGDVILFSPACSSYDEFSNFEERGKFFKNYISAKGKL